MDRAYKRLSKSDVIVTPFTANKQWNIPSASFSSSNIQFYKGVNTGCFNINGPTTTDNQYQYLIYKSVEELYYRNYISASVSSSFYIQNGNLATQSLQSGSYWNYPQSTVGEIRYFPTGTLGGLLDGTWTVSKVCHNIANPGIAPVSCTSSFVGGDQYGEFVEGNWTINGSSIIISQSNTTSFYPQIISSSISYPSTNVLDFGNILGIAFPDPDYYNVTLSSTYNAVTLSLQPNSSNISMSFYLDGIGTNPDEYTIHVLGIPRDIYGSKIKPNTLTISSSDNTRISDDNQGNLYYYSASTTHYVGNIIYPHGMLLFTSHSGIIGSFFTGSSYIASFKNEHIVYENTIKCTIRESEFNYTHNPSISTNTSGSLRDFATGSVFTPYVTTVGLYNDSQELLAVAKMAQPIPLSTNTDTTFLINYDT